MDILNQVASCEGLSSSAVEDWLNVENELPTVGQSSFEDESSDKEEDEGQDEEIVSNSEAVYRGWKERVMLMLFRSCSFEE